MFERFSTEARAIVLGAQQEARALGHDRIGTEHLLLAMLQNPATVSGRALARHGITHDEVAADVVRLTGGEQLDSAALTTLGIDLDAVRERVEEAFGPGSLDGPTGKARSGHIPFSQRPKKVLELGLREAITMGSRGIADGHLLLGLIREGEGLAAKVLHDRGVDLPGMCDEVRLALNP